MSSTTPDPRVELLKRVAGGLAQADHLIRRLDSVAILLRAPAAQAPLLLAIANLCARLTPNILVEAPAYDVSVPPFGQGALPSLAEGVLGSARLSRARKPEARLIVDLGTDQGGADLYVTSDLWNVRLSGKAMVGGGRPGPATSAAAALAAAEIFRRVLPLPGGVTLGGESFEWNLLDYRLGLAPVPVRPSAVEAVCFGAGSVGSSVLYSLLLSSAAGTLDFVDPDRLMERNRVRYPLWLDGRPMPKAHWVEGLATRSALTVRGHGVTAAEFIRSHDPPAVAVSAVDSASARRDITDALARMTLNAGVDGLRFHVSRHGFDDGLACAYCPYLDVETALDEAAVYAELSGLPLDRVRALVAGAVLSGQDISAMTRMGRLPKGASSDELIGGRLQDLARDGLYAQAAVSVGDVNLAVSAPFVSALAGSVLAAELMKMNSEASPYVLDRRIDIDMSGYPMGFQSRPQRDRSGRCLCWDPFRIETYRNMWM